MLEQPTKTQYSTYVIIETTFLIKTMTTIIS